MSSRTTHVRWQVVGFLFLFSFLTIVDRVAISAAKTDISSDLGISDVTFGLVFGVFALGYAIFQVPSGWCADRYGPRKILALIVVLWSLFTGWTGLVYGAAVLITVRFLFGMAEAGIYPTATRAIYSWMPRRARGASQGILFIGSRLGAAFGLAVVSFVIVRFGWRASFLILASLGGILALAWYGWFRDRPEDKSGVSPFELAYIRSDAPAQPVVVQSFEWRLLLSPNALLLMVQYFASNFTFFLAFSWLLPYLRDHYHLTASEAGVYASVPLYFGALANWTSGLMVDAIYRRGRWRLSRLLPALAGFALAASSLVAAASMPTVMGAVMCFSLATLGVDLTLAPSWTVCQDIAGPHTGSVSAAMNMIGNAGSFISSVTFPVLVRLTGSAATYFYLAAVINVVAMLCWYRIRPEKA
jgi:ACS family glucarate transporter-like MFS transporter